MLIRFIVCVTIIVHCYASLAQFALDDQDSDDLYPNYIPVYPVRLDRITKKPVSRGRFELLDRNPWELVRNHDKSVPLAKFKEVLQCAAKEPTMNGVRGTMDMLAMVPPTDKILERVCDFIETRCPWRDCEKIRKENRKASQCRQARHDHNLLRVMKGKLYLDWPYCIFNPTTSFPYESMTILLFHVLDLVSDIEDSVFLVGAEQSDLPWNVPFPMISNSPDFHHSEIPWPWIESMKSELNLYREASNSKNFTEEHYRLPFVKHHLNWHHRIPKAAYYGEMIHIRQVFFDQAMLRPDLIEARWKCDFCHTEPWNPTSIEHWDWYHKNNAEVKPPIFYSKNQSNFVNDKSKVGYLEPLKNIRISEPAQLHAGHYKYLVVLTGINARAASGRLASLLAYSGAVIMLQHNEFEYHFSGRLKPWVHYVPLTYSAADIVNKIEWLKKNDGMAQQLAANARNFGLSYLRLEDQYCYAATALETFGKIFRDSSALKPFSPTEIPYAFVRRTSEEDLAAELADVLTL